MSHAFAIQAAFADPSINQALICEDDCRFVERDLAVYKQFVDAVPHDWAMLYFGGKHLGDYRAFRENDSVWRSEHTIHMHCYAIRRTAAKRVVDALMRLEDVCDHTVADLHSKMPVYLPNQWFAIQDGDPQ